MKFFWALIFIILVGFNIFNLNIIYSYQSEFKKLNKETVEILKERNELQKKVYLLSKELIKCKNLKIKSI